MTAFTRLITLTIVLAACGTPQPPRQLLDARAAYNKARNGKAATLTPAELHTAKVALNTAEKSFQDDPESAGTYALSYVALRAAQLVESQANRKAAGKELEKASRDLQAIQAQQMARTQGELARARQRLSAQGKELAVRGEQLAAADQQLASTAEQLAAERDALAKERAARAAAEEREREAMRKLAEAAALKVKVEPRGTVIILPGNVLFSSGKYELAAGAQHKLTLVAATLAPQAEEHNMVVEGHTDSRGSPGSNLTLARNRANAVRSYLVSRGVLSKAITAVGIGQERPIADNSTREGRQQNRRVEIIIKPIEPR